MKKYISDVSVKHIPKKNTDHLEKNLFMFQQKKGIQPMLIKKLKEKNMNQNLIPVSMKVFSVP